MPSSFPKQRGVSTLIMILAIGAAMAASLYGAYSHMGATAKSQDTSGARVQARAYAEDALAASAEYLNEIFCGSPSSTCASGNAAGLSTTAIPAGLQIVNYSPLTNLDNPCWNCVIEILFIKFPSSIRSLSHFGQN